TLRTLARWVTIVQVVGYTTSLVFVWHTTRLVPPGVAARYRGVDPEATQAAMQFPKSLAEMLTITHTHLLSMAVIFLLTGLGVGCGPPLANLARGRRVRRALVVGDGPAGPRDGIRGLGAGRARRVCGGADGAAAGGEPAHAVRCGERPVRAEPPRGSETDARG